MEYDGIPCSRRDKCRRNLAQNYQNYNIHEIPERDIPSHRTNERNMIESDEIPPVPSVGDPEDWELQYVKWSGWTWVRKSDQRIAFRQTLSSNQVAKSESPTSHQSPKQQKKKAKGGGGCFGCFKGNKDPKNAPKGKNRPEPEPVVISGASNQNVNLNNKQMPPSQQQAYDDCCCCCCCEMDYDPCCCCCCQNQNMPQMVGPENRRNSKSIETQTMQKFMQEKATKTSIMNIPQLKPRSQCCGRRRRCRRVCCPCPRNTCCPCVQPTCCPCIVNNGQATNEAGGHVQKKVNYSQQDKDKLVNFCLASNFGKSKKSDLYDFKSTSFSLDKSLDLLLKNNINIMNLFNNKKELPRETGPSNFSSNHTIACLSSDNFAKTDQEHCKLLTAVCDAILSSHKFDNDKLSSVPTPKEEPQFNNAFSSRGILEKILSDLNFTAKNSNEEHKSKKPETCQAKKSLIKLVRTKSRTLTAPRFPKKVEALRRSIDLKKFGGSDTKNLRRGLFTAHVRRNESRIPRPSNDTKLSFTDIFKKEEPQNKTQEASTSRYDALLNSIDFLNADSIEQNVHLLDDTSPPFTDLDLFLERDKSEKSSQNGKESPSR